MEKKNLNAQRQESDECTETVDVEASSAPGTPQVMEHQDGVEKEDTPSKEDPDTTPRQDRRTSKETLRHVSHWRTLRHSKSPGPKENLKEVTENLRPPTKDIRIQLEKIEPGSPPITQSIFNDMGELIGTRTFSKYADGYKQTESHFSPKTSSSLSKLVSPFSRERKKDEWEPHKSSINTVTKVKDTAHQSPDSLATDSDIESASLTLHLDVTQSSVENEDVIDVTANKASKISDPAEIEKSHVCPEALSEDGDKHSDAVGPSLPPMMSPLATTSPSSSDNDARVSSGRHTTRQLASKINAEVRHLDSIKDIMNSREKMSNSQMITILDRNHLKPDLMNSGEDTFYLSVMKQLHIAGIAVDVHSVVEFRQMIVHHVIFEDNYYKLVADSFLTSMNMSLDECCEKMEKAGNPVTPLDVFATARAINCHFKLFGASSDWSNEYMGSSLEHPTVHVSLIMHSPGEFCSTQRNLGRLSKRKSIKEVFELTKTTGKPAKIGRMTLDMLAAPSCSDTQATTSSQSASYFSPAHVTNKSANIPSADKIKAMGSVKRSLSTALSNEDEKRTKEVSKTNNEASEKSEDRKARKRKKKEYDPDNDENGRGRVTRSESSKAGKLIGTCAAIPPSTPIRGICGKKNQQTTPQQDSRDLTPSDRKQARQSRKDIPRRFSPRLLVSHRDSRSKLKGSSSERRDDMPGATKSSTKSPHQQIKPAPPPSDAGCFGSKGRVTRRKQEDTADKSPQPCPDPSPISQPTSNVLSSTSSSDETDFSCINIEKLSPQDAKYFFNWAVTVIGKLKNKVRQEKGKRSRRSACTYTPTGSRISPARPNTSKAQPKVRKSSRPLNTKSPASPLNSSSSPTGTAATTRASNSDDDSSCSWYQCRTCHRIFSTPARLAEHKAKDHPKRYPCSECSKSFQHLSSLCAHRLLHKNKFFNCIKCDKKFTRKDRLRAHLLAHEGEYRYLCIHCGKGFVQKGHYEGHMMMHAKMKPHTCSKCGHSFHYRQDYLRHTRDSCGRSKKPRVPCDICGNTYKTVKYMRNHRKKHDGYEKFQCPSCGKVFVSSYGFNLHCKRCSADKKK